MRKLKLYINIVKIRTADMIAKSLSVIIKILRHLEFIALFFCVGVGIHYICVFYPRFKDIGEHIAYIQKLGVDYWGIIVGFLTLLVTLLVAWNIYSTIKAKDDIESYKSRLNSEVETFKTQINTIADERLKSMEARMSDFETCCKERGSEIETIKAELGNRIKAAEVEVSMANGLLQFTNAEKAKKDFEKRFYEEAYRHFINALSLYLELNANNGEIRRCTDFLVKCLDGLSDADLSFSETIYNDCIKTLNRILTSSDFTLSERQRRKIEAIKAQQEEVSFTTLYQSIYNFALSVLKDAPLNKGKDKGAGAKPKGDNPH